MLRSETQNWLWFGVVFSLVLFLDQAAVARTYSIEIYDGFDAGWSMNGGTITTNGFVGTIDETSVIDDLFTDWSIEVTSPRGSFEFTRANSTFTAVDSSTFDSDDVVTVDEREINVRFDPFSVDLALTSTAGHSILWNGPRYSQGFGNIIAVLGSVELHDVTASSVRSFGSCFAADPGCPDVPDDLLIASVPEPASGMSLLLCIAAAFCKARRAMRSRPRQTTYRDAVNPDHGDPSHRVAFSTTLPCSF